METVCLQCGDRGYPETLVFCNECRACALHRYCLDGPVIFNADVTWFCEDCKPKPVVPFSLDQSAPLSSETSDSVNLAKDSILASRELKNCIKRVKKSDQQQQISVEEKQRKTKVKSGVVAKTKDPLSDDSVSPPQLEHIQCSNSCEEESMFKNECGPVPRDAANSNIGSKTAQISQVVNSDDLNCVELDGHVAAQPIADPIWRGTLNVCSETIGAVGLLAHLSSLACSKVLEETTHFPEVLLADLLPRSTVWPKSFKNAGPTDQSIALYFFPENERAEKVFDKLVDDLIHLELAIKIVAENAELLIFPSTVLPIQNRRFQAKYYLWGVFRRKQTSHKTNDAACREDAGVDKPLTCHNHSSLTCEDASSKMEPFVNIPDDTIREALKVVLDVRNQPPLLIQGLLISNNFVHCTVCIAGCIRRQQRWCLLSVLDVYLRLAGSKARVCETRGFMELFDISCLKHGRIRWKTQLCVSVFTITRSPPRACGNNTYIFRHGHVDT